jgi:hypothetical protein
MKLNNDEANQTNQIMNKYSIKTYRIELDGVYFKTHSGATFFVPENELIEKGLEEALRNACT